MPVQSPADRFLMQDTAAATYLPAATYNAFAATKGQPNGLATLGADGKVPQTQIPAGALTAVKPTFTDRTNSTALLNDPHLILSSLAAGVYRIEFALMSAGGFTALNFRLGNGTGDPAPVLTFNDRGLLQYTNTSAGVSSVGDPGTVRNLGGNSVTLGSGVATLTAGALAVVWAQATAGATASRLAAGSYLRAERIG